MHIKSPAKVCEGFLYSYLNTVYEICIGQTWTHPALFKDAVHIRPCMIDNRAHQKSVRN